MKKYVIVFGGAYFFLTALSAAYFADSSGGGSVNFAITIGASFLAAAMFARDHGREPTPEEKSSYAWGALLASLFISAILVASFVSFFFSAKELAILKSTLNSPSFLTIALAILLLVSAIYYFVIRWSFSWYATRAAR